MVKRLRCRRPRFEPWVGKIHWRRKWLPTSVFLPGEFHGQRSLVDYSPWSYKRVGHNLATGQAISSVQLLSHVQLFMTPWTAARQTFLSITNFQSLLKLMSIESVMPSNHLILCHPFSSHLEFFPVSGSFHMNQFFASGGQSIEVSASTSVLQMNQIRSDQSLSRVQLFATP